MKLFYLVYSYSTKPTEKISALQVADVCPEVRGGEKKKSELRWKDEVKYCKKCPLIMGTGQVS